MLISTDVSIEDMNMNANMEDHKDNNNDMNNYMTVLHHMFNCITSTEEVAKPAKDPPVGGVTDPEVGGDKGPLVGEDKSPPVRRAKDPPVGGATGPAAAGSLCFFREGSILQPVCTEVKVGMKYFDLSSNSICYCVALGFVFKIGHGFVRKNTVILSQRSRSLLDPLLKN